MFSLFVRPCLPNILSFAALEPSVVRMAAPKPISRPVSHVILDLDGTLLNTGDWKLENAENYWFWRCRVWIKFTCLVVWLWFPWWFDVADSVVSKVVKPFLVKNGKTWDSKKAHKLVGKTSYEAASVVLEDYGLPYSTEEFLSMITPMFSEQ